MEERSRAVIALHVAVGMAVAIARLGAVKGFEFSPMSFLELSLGRTGATAPHTEVGIGR